MVMKISAARTWFFGYFTWRRPGLREGLTPA
jgi:hypothetical protein